MRYYVRSFKKYQNSNKGYVTFLMTSLYFNTVIEVKYFYEYQIPHISFLHSCLNCGNILCMDQYKYNKTKKLASKQKQALTILNNEFTDIREIIVRMKVLNIST